MTEQPYIHPAFPQPDDPSAVIWRYMDAPKLEWLVNCARLFMPSADRLGDPLEGSTPPGELEWWQREAANAESEEMRRIIEHNRAFLSRMAEVFRNHFYYVACWHIQMPSFVTAIPLDLALASHVDAIDAFEGDDGAERLLGTSWLGDLSDRQRVAQIA